MNSSQSFDATSIRETLRLQRAAFLAAPLASAEARIELLERAAVLLLTHGDELIEALNADFGVRSPTFSRGLEIQAPLATIRQTQANLERWMQPEARESAQGEAWVQYQPLGVVGVMTPWNGPVNLLFNGLAGALAAGNRVMLKPSEATPRTSALLAALLGSVYAQDEVAVITGGADVASAFCSQPFDHLLFTGAASIGREVMRAAAEHLVPVTLELGGKSPVIISRSADVASAAAAVTMSKMNNSGQICVAPDYVFVPEELLASFVAATQAAIAAHYPSLRDNPEVTSIINRRHFERLHGYLDEARAAGVELIELNPAGENLTGQAFHKMIPTLLINPGDELQVMQNEIFGPLLPIKTYRELDEVLAYVNARPRPLALYYFGLDAIEEQQVLARTCSGGVTINGIAKHAGLESLPFGGVGASGMGAYRGFDGFRRFSHGKAVFRA
ncbi:coniferyl aldehyde dehydrogenase [Pseudomonas sp. LS44]|uniref:coniferyl aldehyde dehydrogenase n=1 Tax=Pseudomonas sp. LS44 TaxID=1357074 RepID=UPI00215A2A60|nr:coniferyl aldehyde dehydrogenase [Pseudomonas sp. LS44]UVE19556.1 coniferyl aldehyde dehydrogenase [Pseudomonas sp. LS44]